MLKQMKRTLRKIKRVAMFRPWIVHNQNTNKKQLFWKTRIRGKELIVKKKNITRLSRENAHRRALLKILNNTQGKTYSLRMAKRYPAPLGKVIEQYHNLPTRADVLNLYVGKQTSKVKQLLKRAKLTSVEALIKCEEAHNELMQNLCKCDDLYYSLDYVSGNVLVDIDKNGKVIFTLVDY